MKYIRIYNSVVIFFFSFISFSGKSQVSITSLPQTYTQNFDASLGTANIVPFTNNTTVTGWYITSANLIVNTGTTNTNNCYNFGIAGTNPLSDRALGAISTATTHRFGLRIANNSGSAINSFALSFTGEQWRSFNAGTLVFEYQQAVTVTSITTGTWTAVTAFDFASLVTSGGAATDGNATANRTAIAGTLTVTVPAGEEIMLRWTRAGTSSPGLAIDDLSITANAGCAVATSTYYYRSLITGNWSNVATWEASPNGSTGWVSACTPPTNAAAGVTILSGHTVTVDATTTAPDVTVNSGGVLQANSSSFVTLTMNGNLINNGTLQFFNGTKGVNLVFNKNGNQSISGSGGTTNFYSIGVNMGATNANVLDISPTNFSCSTTNILLNNVPASTLLNGTVKFSGTYTFSNSLFNTSPTIPATAAIWINNPNVTITPKNYSYTISGYLRITSGVFSEGTSLGNSILLLTNSSLIIEGGTLNVAARIQAVNSSGTVQNGVTYNQSGGLVNILTVGSTSGVRSGLEFDNATDNFIISGGTIVFRNQATAVELYNYATCTVTGGTIQFADASSTNINSTGFYINSPSALPSIVINNSLGLNPLVNLYDDLTIIGSITINAGATLSNSYDSGTHFFDIYDIYDISLTGDWNNSGTFANWNSNKVTFNGSSAQLMTGSTSTTFNRLTINNSSGGVTLQTNESVDSVLTLSNGYVYTTSNLLTMNVNSSVGAVSNSSFVYGPIAKVGSNDFVFPVGKDLEYRPIADSALSGSETFTAEYFHTSPSPTYDITLHDPTIDHVSSAEYWILNRAGTTNAFVKLSWDTYSGGVSFLSDLTVARWDGTTWKDHGNGGTTGNTTTGTVITTGLVTSFSPFTLASINANTNPLPVELINFTATYNGTNTVNLNWATASETNNDYFTIERSADAIHFDEINKTNGAGNSNQIINYSAIDNSPLQGVSYYRLKQTDFNGNYKYSNVVSVTIKNNTGFEIINTYSSSENGLEVTINCGTNSELCFELYDDLGNKVFTTKQTLSGNNSKVIIPMDKLSKGIYLLKVVNGEKIISRKIII